jgi:hypothetical protein
MFPDLEEFAMFERNWLRRLRCRFFSTTTATTKGKVRQRMLRQTTRPMLESLESRIVPATQVFSPGDVPSLIQDLQAASNDPKDTTIINLKANTTYTLTAVNNYFFSHSLGCSVASAGSRGKRWVLRGKGALTQNDISSLGGPLHPSPSPTHGSKS